MSPREFATQVVKTLRSAGHEALFAGGCVRDQMLGHEPQDFDVATSAHPEQVQKLFRRSIAVGAAFGVIEVLGPDKHKVQVATFRSDGPYTDARRPDHVVYSSAREDAERRDFTINGMFFDPLDDKVIDYVGGEKDVQARVLRAIGDPVARFKEDRLRLLRAVRFAARFALTIEPATWAAIQTMAPQEITVSGERIAEELRKLLTHESRAEGIKLLRESGLLRAILPEIEAGAERPLTPSSLVGEGGVGGERLDVWQALTPHPSPPPQGGREPEDAGREPSFPLVFAVLVAKVPLDKQDEMFERLRLSNVERDRIHWLVAHQSALAEPAQLPLHVLKPLLAHPGIGELLILHRAFGNPQAVEWCEQRMKEWPREKLDPPPLVTGDDLIHRGLTPGPKFKVILDAIRNAQLDEKISTRDEALAMIPTQHLK